MNTSDLNLFVRTADSGSITRAAEQLDMTSAAASAALKRLEKNLETQLFIRSTRQLRITNEGERFLAYCREALNNLESGLESIHAMQGKVAGELRISAPSDLGRNLLLEWIDDFMDEHPGISVNLVLGDSIADFYNDRIDVAVRYGKLDDSNMVAFKLANVGGALCASPSYIEAFGTPVVPQDLAQHNCLLYQRDGRRFDTWEFISESSPDEAKEKVRVSGNRSSNDSDVVRLWALGGKGITYKSRVDMYDELHTRQLIPILPGYRLPKIEINMVCPTRSQITPAVLLLRDFFRERFSLLEDI